MGIKDVANKVRRWLSLIFNKSKTMQDITQVQISDEHYNLVDQWKAIYAGYFSDWHDVKYKTINGQKKRRMHTLNMAKVASEELSKLIFTEKVSIDISDDVFQDNINDVLDDNRFYKVFQGELEKMLALGGLILKAHPKEQPDGSYKLIINYITPDCFIPISYENDHITEGVFLTVSKKKDKTYCLFEFHQWKYTLNETDERVKSYVIKNELYENDRNSNETARKVPLNTLYEDLEEIVTIDGLSQPMFQYLKPNKANNFELNSPLGISIFANAKDTLFAIDNAFDSFVREFKLGKRRIIVPSASIRSVIDTETGTMDRYFDADDEVYEAFSFADPEKQKIMDNTVPLRVDEHVAAINSLLNLFSMQVGFSSGTFTFDGQSVKTATEIVSEKSKTYQTKQSNENLIEEGLRNFIHTLGEVGSLYDMFEVPIDDYDTEFFWDDSIIKDKHTESDFFIKLKNNGLASAKYTLMKIMNLTDEEAQKMIDEINEENATVLGEEDEKEAFGGVE